MCSISHTINTAFIRVQLSFSTNEGASEALALLQPIFEKYSDVISFSDLIVYAATIAVEAAGGPAVPFCPGRVDAQDGVTDTDFSPREYYLDPLIAQRDTIDVRFMSLFFWFLEKNKKETSLVRMFYVKKRP